MAIDVLGFSPALAPRHQRQKLRRVVAALADAGVVAGPVAFDKHPGDTPRAGSYSVVLARGSRYVRPASPDARCDSHSPLWDGLTALGFEAGAAGRLLKEFPRAAVREWLDITVAARERFGRAFFTRSPQAYLVDNLRHALASGRTPPEWWHDLRSRERQGIRAKPDPSPVTPPRSRLASPSQPDQTAAVLRRVAEAAFAPADEPAPSPSPTVPTLAAILRTRR